MANAGRIEYRNSNTYNTQWFVDGTQIGSSGASSVALVKAIANAVGWVISEKSSELTAESLEEEIACLAREDFSYTDGWWDDKFWDEDNSVFETVFGTATIVDRGPDKTYDQIPMYVIVELNGRHFRKDGVYSSWDSTSWDGPLYEVKAKEVVKTEYERI